MGEQGDDDDDGYEDDDGGGILFWLLLAATGAAFLWLWSEQRDLDRRLTALEAASNKEK